MCGVSPRAAQPVSRAESTEAEQIQIQPPSILKHLPPAPTNSTGKAYPSDLGETGEYAHILAVTLLVRYKQLPTSGGPAGLPSPETYRTRVTGRRKVAD